MKCQQCLSPRGELAEYRVRSDVIDIKVCQRCAEKAQAIGLNTTRLSENPDQPVDHKHAA
jgi:protein-arginine kinase activator protein McsA